MCFFIIGNLCVFNNRIVNALKAEKSKDKRYKGELFFSQREFLPEKFLVQLAEDLIGDVLENVYSLFATCRFDIGCLKWILSILRIYN